MRRSRLLAAVLAGLLSFAAPALAATPPVTDSDNADPKSTSNPYGWFEAGLEWRGDFPDPHVIRVGSLYYAYSTPTAGRYLPLLTSTDLVRWRAHPRWTTAPAPWAGGPDPRTDRAIPAEIRQAPMSAGDIWNLNDALVAPPAWAQRIQRGPWIAADYWAPGVAQIGAAWFAYGAVKVSDASDDPDGIGRFCITVASAPSPLGPFRDVSGAGPIVCDVDPAGSIDPFPYLDETTGRHYLLWKAAGRRTSGSVRGYPSALKAVPIGGDGRPVPGAATVTLLTTNEGTWEGTTIENPAMARWLGTTYLFYSGNHWGARPDGTSDYATGYAICPDGPRAPCTRPEAGPLLAGFGDLQGPGGASALVDATGALRLAFHYYWRGEYRADAAHPHPRRLAVTQLVPRGDGTLDVGAAAPVAARDIDTACATDVRAAGYRDVDPGSPAARAIDCVTARGIATGTGDDLFAPTATVTRGQMASFLTKAIQSAGGTLPASAPDAFADDNGTVHEAAANRLAAAGVVSGVRPGSYAPTQAVTREQMATFLERAARHLAIPAAAPLPDPFADDAGSVHERSIIAMASAGIATGIAPGAFGPRRPVSRAQMALFLARLLDFDAG